jgi:zinc finger protein
MVEEKEDVIKKEKCPMCHTDNLELAEMEKEIPYFGKVFLFSMTCSNCKYHVADIESVEQKPACKVSFEVKSEADMNVRVVKSSNATVKIPRIMTIEPGPVSQGYVTNIEGLLNRAKSAIETARDTAEDEEDKKKAKNLLKKLQRIKWGQESIVITIEDPTGNSAIISEKASKK